MCVQWTKKQIGNARANNACVWNACMVIFRVYHEVVEIDIIGYQHLNASLGNNVCRQGCGYETIS